MTSVFTPVKNLILSEMRASDKKLKKAVTNVLNAIDSDLTIEGYRASNEVNEALGELDNVLIELDTQPEPDEGDIVITRKLPENPAGYRDLSEQEG